MEKGIKIKKELKKCEFSFLDGEIIKKQKITLAKKKEKHYY